ncbi:MAG: sulfatase-like hydrolase/transferase [Kiritimatiellae bacterium]|nr:sulfatase-like hydrolase/transferase [Kiritimatiellia bacterium]
MKKARENIARNGILVVAAAFGALNLFDAFWRFGWRTDVSPSCAEYLFDAFSVAVSSSVCWTAFWCAVTMLAGRKAKWILAPAFLAAALMECSCFYAKARFGVDLPGEWLAMLRHTNTRIFAGFVDTAASPLLLAGGAVFIVWIGAIVHSIWRAEYPGISRRTLVALPVCAAMAVFTYKGNETYVTFLIGGLKQYSYGQTIAETCGNNGLPERLDTTVPFEELPDCVFVVGESSSRRNWSLYGYPRKTTPQMEKLRDAGELVVFTDVLGVSYTTWDALSILMTDLRTGYTKAGGWTLAGAYDRAGYNTLHFANHITSDALSSVLYMVFNGSRRRYFREQISQSLPMGGVLTMGCCHSCGMS